MSKPDEELDQALIDILNASKGAKFEFGDTSAAIKKTEVKVKPVIYTESTAHLIKLIQEMNGAIDNLAGKERLKDVSSDCLMKILKNTSQIDLAIRDTLVVPLSKHRQDNVKKYAQISKIHIGTPFDSVLCISLPPLIADKYRGSYAIYHKVRAALEVYFAEHERPDLQGQKLLLIYKKYSPFRSVMDNDNWEAKRVTNAISEQLHYADNTDNFSFLYTTVHSAANCVEALLIPVTSLSKYQDYLCSSMPIQPYPKA